MNPLFHTDFSISDSLKNVRKSVLIYETIIIKPIAGNRTDYLLYIFYLINLNLYSNSTPFSVTWCKIGVVQTSDLLLFLIFFYPASRFRTF